MHALALVDRALEQLLEALALTYGVAHGSALAARFDTTRVLLSLAVVLAATYALVEHLERKKRETSGGASASGAAVETACAIVVFVQRYATYAFAIVLRARAVALFARAVGAQLRVLVAPLLVVVLASGVAALVEHFRVAPRLEGARAPLALVERFVDAVAFAYGLAGATRERAASSSLLVAMLVVACSWARDALAPPSAGSNETANANAAAAANATANAAANASTLRTAALHVVLFVEQYALYIVARLVAASALVRSSALTHGVGVERLTARSLLDSAVLLMLVCALVAASALVEALTNSLLALAPRRLLDRFVDAVVVTAAFAHAAALAHQLNVADAVASLVALLVASYAWALAAPESTHAGAAYACSRSVASRAGTYATYALVQLALSRTVVASTSTLVSLLVSCAVPLALAALVVALRNWRPGSRGHGGAKGGVDALAVIGYELIDDGF